MNLTANVCGRGGEAAKASFDQMCYFPAEECLAMNWGELKTLEQDLVPIIVDVEKWRICPINSFAWYRIGGGADKQQAPGQKGSYIFPARSNLKNSGASTKLSRELQVPLNPA